MSDPTPAAPPPPPPTPAPPPAPPKERTWTPLFGVIVVILVVGFGGFVVAGEPRRVVDQPDPDPLNRVEIISGVTLAPVEGWEVVDRYRQPVGDGEIDAVRLSSGTASLDALVGTFGGGAEDLFLIYVDEVLLPFADQLEVSDQVETFTTDQGHRGVRGFYLGVFPEVQAPIEGEVSAVVTEDGLGIITDAWTNDGQLALLIDATRAMTASLEVG